MNKAFGYITADTLIYDFRREKLKVLEEVKKVRFTKPKGETDLKNINFRISDNRYIGRKMLGGYQITVYAKTQKECAEKLKKEIDTLFNRKVEKTNNKFTFKELYLKWYHQEKEPFIAKETKTGILVALSHLAPFHEKNIKKITKQEIITFFSQIEDGRKKEKIKIYLNACLNYYLKEGLIPVNPCANVRILKSHNKNVAFTYEEQKTILDKLKDKPLRVIILIYLITGLRRRELNFTSIEKDIDVENRILKAVNLKGRNLVKRYKQIKLSRQAISLIMNNVDIIHSYTDETAYREFSEVLKELKIKGSIVNCRHTFATNCFYLNKPELVISREMGHSTSIITKDVYTDIDYHLSETKVKEIYNNLYNQF